MPVAGEPFSFHQLRLLASNGFTDVVFLIGYMGERIMEAVGDGQAFGIKVRYVSDGPVLLGTGGSIAQALPALSDPFAVIYGDLWLEIDYRAAIEHFLNDGRPALMTVYRNNPAWDQSNVEFVDGEIRVYRKEGPSAAMTHIDYGFSLFRKNVFDNVPADRPTDLAVLVGDLAAKGRLASFEVFRRYYEIGSFSGRSELEDHFASLRRVDHE